MSNDFTRDAVTEVVGALIPIPLPVGTVAGRAYDAIRTMWERHTSVALHAAEVCSGLTRHELEQALQRDDSPVLPLYVQVLWAAGETGHEETLQIMGVALGQAIGGAMTNAPETIGQAERVLRAVRNFTPDHFRALRRVAEVPAAGTERRSVATSLNMSEGSASGILTNLLSAGLVTQIVVHMSQTLYEISDLGQAVLEAGVAYQAATHRST